MKLDFTDLSYDAKQYDFGDARLNIRPYPSSLGNILVRDQDMVISGSDRCKVFKYCLTDWENVVGADGKPLPCTDEVKQKLFDFNLNPKLIMFVMEKSRQFEKIKEEEEKNS